MFVLRARGRVSARISDTMSVKVRRIASGRGRVRIDQSSSVIGLKGVIYTPTALVLGLGRG